MGKYDDMLELAHVRSTKHPHMSMEDRAAQFAPFAALTGLEDEMDETARLTKQKIVLDEGKLAQLDIRIQTLNHALWTGESKPKVRVTYFVPDQKKDGGAYEVYEGTLKKIDGVRKLLLFDTEMIIEMEQIYEIEVLEP